jgi:hypothetical protein
MNINMFLRVGALCLAVLLAGACGGSSPTAPTPGAATTTTPPATAPATNNTPVTPPPTTPSGAVTWQFTNDVWVSSATPPACPSPVLSAPVDFAIVTSILYPGQTRGGNYKAHGGFRFDLPGQASTVAVAAPMDATVYRGARYIEGGEVQYMFDFINSCGVMFRFDHLRDLSAKFQRIAGTLPGPTESSATTVISGESVSAGEAIATAIGFRNNVAVDFGVYDLRQRNAVAADPAWLAGHRGELSPYGVCWFDWFSSGDAARLKALPAGDQQMGRTSDFCR